MMIRLPSYLQLSAHGIYYFRAVVPERLRAQLGCREIKRSLGTRSRAEAVARAGAISLSISRLYAFLRQSSAMLTYAQFKELMQRYLEEQMARFERYFERSGPLELQFKLNLEQSLRYHRTFSELDVPTETGVKATERILKKEGIELDSDSKAFQRIAAWATKFMVGQIERILTRNADVGRLGQAVSAQDLVRPEARPGLPQGNPSVTPRQGKGNPSGLDFSMAEGVSSPLSEVLAQYQAEKVREGSWTEKTQHTARGKFELLERILGDVPIREIGAAQARDFKQVLQRLPSNFNARPLYRSKTIAQIVAMNAEPRMSVRTVNNYLTWASGFFDWAERHGYVDKNPFRGMLLKNPKRADEARAAYTREELRILFSTPQYREHSFKHPHYYWLPLLGGRRQLS